MTFGVLGMVILMAALYAYLNTYDYNRLKPLFAQMVEDATGRTLSLGGDVNFKIGFGPQLVVRNIALSNAAWGTQPQMIEIEKLQAQVRLLPLLFKDLKIHSIRLMGVKVLLETGPDARKNWDFHAGRKSTPSAGAIMPAEIDVDQISVENLQLTFRSHQTGSKTKFKLTDLAINRQGTKDELTLSLRADYEGHAVTLSGTTGSIHRLLKHERFPVQLSASYSNTAVNIDGTIGDILNLAGIDLRLNASGRDLAEIGSLLGANLPRLGAFDVSGKISGSAKSLSIDKFAAKVDKSDFKGLVRVAFAERPKITVQLESSVIDCTALMKSPENDKQKPVDKQKQKNRLFSDAPLPFDALKKVDADIRLNARNIYAEDMQLDFGHLTLKLEDGDFSIDRLEATYKQSKLSGHLQIHAGAPSQVAVNFMVQNFNLGDFLKETGKSDQVRAIIDMAAHGKSRGDSVRSLMANLDGSIGAVMGEGYLTKYLDLLSVGLSSKVLQFWKPPKTADQIKCAVVLFDVRQGIATSRAFVFNTQAGILAGKGQIDLGTEKINFLLVPKPSHPDLGLATKLRVSGTVMDPKVGVDKLAALTRGAEALSSLVVGPLGLLAPFVHLGAHKKHPCKIESIEQLGLSKPEKQ